MAFVTIGAKKFDRYLLPVFPALDLLAGVGWVYAVRWGHDLLVRGRKNGPRDAGAAEKGDARLLPRPTFLSILTLLIVLQGATIWTGWPYYLAIYNPWPAGWAPRCARCLLDGEREQSKWLRTWAVTRRGDPSTYGRDRHRQPGYTGPSRRRRGPDPGRGVAPAGRPRADRGDRPADRSRSHSPPHFRERVGLHGARCRARCVLAL